MVSLSILFLCLLVKAKLFLTVSIPCEGDGPIAGDACNDIEQTSYLLQTQSRASKPQLVALPRPTPVPAPAAPAPPSGNAADGSYPVFPLNCTAHGKPVQMMKFDGGFEARSLDIASGNYTPIFDVRYTALKGMYSDLNACGVNPFDDILYCIMNSALVSYMVRLSPGRVAFLAKLRHLAYNTGGFGPTGAYYIATHVGNFTVIDNAHSLKGFEDQFDAGIPDMTKLPIEQPKGFFDTGDVVVVTYDFEGTGAGNYLMSLAGRSLQIAKWDGKKFSGSWVVPASPGAWGENYGAAWNFEGKVFFASNTGSGVFQVPLDQINLKTLETINLTRVGSSAKGEFNDGFNCMSQPDPWLTNVIPFDCKTHGTDPIQTVKGPFGYSVKKLSLETGRLLDLYDINYKTTNPPFKFLNAVGINPKDKIPYGCLMMDAAPGPMYVVRFDSERIEYVGKLQGSFNPIGGTFDTNGRFYFVTYPENDLGYIMALDGLDALKGYDFPNATGIADFSRSLAVSLPQYQIADIVSISYPDKQNRSVDHVIGINRDRELVVVKWDGAQSKVHELRTNNILGDLGSKLNLGAAWNLDGRIMFASNDGVGVFEASAFSDKIGYLYLKKILESSSVANTDGFSCPAADPFAGYQNNPVIQKMIQYNW